MKDHMEMDRVEGCPVGRDPRTLSAGDLETLGKPRISRGDAIRAKCLDCAGGSSAEVRRCGMIDCALWAFRMGADPYRAPMSEERRQAAAERLAIVRRRLRGAPSLRRASRPLLPALRWRIGGVGCQAPSQPRRDIWRHRVSAGQPPLHDASINPERVGKRTPHFSA